MRRLAVAACLLAAGLTTGCAATSGPRHAAVDEPPRRPYSEFYGEGPVLPIDVPDPLEGLNRRVYWFNAVFDRYIFLPVVNAYEAVTPDFVEDRVSDFFSNLTELGTLANSVLQLKVERANRAATRFVVNSLFTLGTFDLAGARGIEQRREDFGETLGVWGVPDGPYLVLPLFGPSTLRDAAGLAVDAAAFSLAVPASIQGEPAYLATRFGLQPIDTRHRVEFRYYETGSPFEYELVRLLYTEKRELDVGN